ncbi:cytochrome c oxidase subunit II [Candidatus Parcubacteria bacterium]|nr:cytochrome c oxidase subunit II [Candidatus Parcubacteria bacterium]
MKRILIVVALVVVAAVGVVLIVRSSPASAPPSAPGESESAPVNPMSGNAPEGMPSGSTGGTDVSAQPANEQLVTREFTMIARQFVFEPNTITVKKGERVRLRITSVDVTHGFGLPEFDVSANLSANAETTVEFTASKVGTFTFSCTVFCGSGHSGMRGTLEVTE